MPKCKNDPTQYYVGDEESPLGLGFCSNVEKEDTAMQGNDGNLWIINKNKEWEEYQTYPYISIIIWLKDFKKEFKNFFMNIDSPEVFVEIKNIVKILDDNDVGYELGWTNMEIDLSLFDNFETLDKSFFREIKEIKKLSCDDKNIIVNKSEVCLLKLKNNNEEIILI